MTIGTSKFGFETDQDRERKKLIESQKERALEARKRAREQKAVDLARLLDPVMREILTDFLSAYEMKSYTIFWDGNTCWRINRGSSPEAEWSVKINLQADDKGLFLQLDSTGRPTAVYKIGNIDEYPRSIQRLVAVLEETMELSVRLPIFDPASQINYPEVVP